MEDARRQAVVLSLIEKLDLYGIWCGETHIQKSLYFLQEMLKVPTCYDFILYKHGPFSFDFRDELAVMRSKMIIELQSKPYPYGPSLHPGEAAERLKELYPKTTKEYEQKIDFIAKKLACLRVAELERLATALYVTLEKGGDKKVQARAIRINELKPHVKIDEALRAVEEVESLMAEAEIMFH
ncbi:MAG: hypothetical protein A4E52_01437 [Pelotomaculum sp. PtaB.Bin013]|uniref:Antitoxin SocA-like Panacea domain-containing protein n=1 Tax=Pelotomaculum isophthalicicum JI TaxID=947010 RepID=A0A9X4GYH2_9FIRM|nr:hypothetical protein [Pelotomaculum isophthalicicum]MDF9407777.1 hypothetical protein [Pelotomaculum isophthalicicum JI]OPX87033.1 MAG: hypothetical protein A4E52_01437 [Pelotomaculum sp. PtaB.Bin013]